ncbi:MAG TPA: cyclic nucleotide-binding domain-containing protein [Mycobacteriales bacterium]|jgi:CRP-like cAMP-binding protein|nr:cyclic nucleotide-binding domain-containing protein [Mycobacteriales bacterium]
MRNRGQSSIDLLGEIPLFRGCSKDELKLIDRAATQADYPAGHVLCTEGAVGRELIMIVEGEARVERGGTELAVVGPGGFVGEMSLLDGGPRSATVTTTTEVKALILPTREFWQVIDEVPAIAHRLLATLAERLRTADEAAN